MRKTLILALTMLASPLALAATEGATPLCTSGKVNVEIYNKNLDDCAGDGSSKYCIYDLNLSSDDHDEDQCTDDSETLVENSNESYSLTHPSAYLQVIHNLYKKGGPRRTDLRFYYQNGSITDNCDEVFDSDVQCIVTKSGTANHLFYKVTIVSNK